MFDTGHIITQAATQNPYFEKARPSPFDDWRGRLFAIVALLTHDMLHF